MGCSNSAVLEASTSGLTSREEARLRRSLKSHKFYFEGLLGEGGFAKVYAVKEEASGRLCAVKAPRRRVAAEDLGDLAREEELWKKVSPHENIVQLFEGLDMAGPSGQAERWLLTERCGDSLMECRTWLRREGAAFFPRLARGALLALGAIHRCGIVHRDVKPANFLLGGPGELTVKLCDFGLAAAVPKIGFLTEAVGSTPFISPEMVASMGYGTKTDLWSLGVSLYVLLFDSFPFGGDNFAALQDADRKSKEDATLAAIRTGTPSYRPAPTCPASWRAPPGAVDLVQSELLERSQSRRADAGRALEHAFVSLGLENSSDKEEIEDISRQTSSTWSGSSDKISRTPRELDLPAAATPSSLGSGYAGP